MNRRSSTDLALNIFSEVTKRDLPATIQLLANPSSERGFVARLLGGTGFCLEYVEELYSKFRARVGGRPEFLDVKVEFLLSSLQGDLHPNGPVQNSLLRSLLILHSSKLRKSECNSNEYHLLLTGYFMWESAFSMATSLLGENRLKEDLELAQTDLCIVLMYLIGENTSEIRHQGSGQIMPIILDGILDATEILGTERQSNVINQANVRLNALLENTKKFSESIERALGDKFLYSCIRVIGKNLSAEPGPIEAASVQSYLIKVTTMYVESIRKKFQA